MEERKEKVSMVREKLAMPHVLLFPFPAQGHVSPMLKLADLLSTAGLYITFVNTDNIHRRFLSSSPNFDRLALRTNFRFRTIPDYLPDDDPLPFSDILGLIESLGSRSREHYRDLLVSKEDPDGWPLVTCVVADGNLPLAYEVAEEVNIPLMLLRTSSACSVWVYCSIPELIQKGEFPFQEGADMDEPIGGVAGMESFLRRRDCPGGFVREAKCITDPKIQLMTTNSKALARGRALILNTVESLDSLVLPHIRSICPITYTIGPLQLLTENIAYGLPNEDGDNVGNLTSSNSASIWQEDQSCMIWLDSQPNNSVVYVSFGTFTVMSRDAFLEFWHGLVNSRVRFLWVIRPNMVEGGIDVSEFDTKDQGYFVEWAPQKEVLAHSAVGCFLTHSGWNSTLESIIAGVPMICWPFFADQQVTSRFVSDVWKIGVDMKDTCGRNIVEEMVRRVMDGDEVEKWRSAVREMSHESRKAAEEGGSSYANFQNLVKHIKSLSFLARN